MDLHRNALHIRTGFVELVWEAHRDGWVGE
jgi:hypothetical protein